MSPLAKVRKKQGGVCILVDAGLKSLSVLQKSAVKTGNVQWAGPILLCYVVYAMFSLTVCSIHLVWHWMHDFDQFSYMHKFMDWYFDVFRLLCQNRLEDLAGESNLLAWTKTKTENCFDMAMFVSQLDVLLTVSNMVWASSFLCTGRITNFEFWFSMECKGCDM